MISGIAFDRPIVSVVESFSLSSLQNLHDHPDRPDRSQLYPTLSIEVVLVVRVAFPYVRPTLKIILGDWDIVEGNLRRHWPEYASGFLFLLFKNISSDNFLCYFKQHPIINLLTR